MVMLKHHQLLRPLWRRELVVELEEVENFEMLIHQDALTKSLVEGVVGLERRL